MAVEDIKTIEKHHIPPLLIKEQINNDANKSLKEILEGKERELIQDALNKTNNNVTQAAELLKIPRQTLQYRIIKLIDN